MYFSLLKSHGEGLAVYGEFDGEANTVRENLSLPRLIDIESQAKSMLSGLIVKGTRGIQRIGLQLSGGVNFYKASVSMYDCLFIDSQGEDMLNMINSKFSINQSRFENTYSDALDSDFSQGYIWDTSFANIKGDALDFSGSNVRLSSIQTVEIGDKAISVGEASRIIGDKIKIKAARYGLVSKDNSFLQIRDAHLENLEVALLSFQKKPEYGPGNLRVSKVKFIGVKENYWLEENSWMTLEEELLAPNKTDIAKTLYPPPSKTRR